MISPSRPPANVLATFELEGDVIELGGGKEVSLLIDGTVLKQVQDIAVSAWSQ